MKLITTLLILFHSALLSISQNYVSEQEVAYQDKFIEAKSFELLEKYEKAEKILLELYKDDRTNAAVNIELSQLYQKMDNPNKEFKHGIIASQNAPKNQAVLSIFGATCLRQQNYLEAEKTYKKLIDLYPTNEMYTDKYATSLLFQNREDEAIKAYNSLENKIGVTEDVSRRKIEIYQFSDNKLAMIKEFEKLIDVDPNNITALHNLATTYKNNGDHDAANEIYKTILTIDINDTKANVNLIGDDINNPENDENYLRALNPIIDNENVVAKDKIIELIPYAQKLAANPEDKNLASALSELSQRLVAIHPKSAKSHAFRGDILYLSGNAKDAIKHYEKTLEINDNVYSVWEQLMYALNETKNWDKLDQISESAIDLFPNKASAYYLHGIANKKLKKISEAIEFLSEGILISGKDKVLKTKIYTELSQAYLEDNNISNAIKNIDKAIDISNSLYPIALKIKGDILSQKGENKKAQKLYDQAEKLGPQSNISKIK